ncbi:CPBP family intramembrane glutamic endopeptidase [Halosolutus amylolyticus]|uniref:CPBP family intramembrane glutamic endopeptidase n=1 Tax=Halosolutus amylolyticus TaxID=2932267 RepID=A0ABD5PTC8_9EURY|nr:CPBP family intramembrane glutamic endopeptidase [Halosolutus amylolyticus]
MNETARADDAGPYASGAAPAVGTVLAAVTVAAMAVPVRRGVDDPIVWTGAAFALAAVLAFLGSRHGRIDRQLAGSIAAASSFAVVLLSGYALNQGVSVPVTLPAIGWSISLLFTAFLTAGVATGIGVADYFGIGGRGLKARGLQVTLLLVVGLSGLIAAQVATILLALPVFAVVEPPLSQLQAVVLSQFGMAFGTAAVAVGYLAVRQFDRSYIDLKLPTKRDAAWTIGGVLVLFGVLFSISLLFQSTGVESADHSTAQQAQENPEIMLVLVPAAILIIGPFEELLYRNVIQKSLYESFSRVGAVVVASVIFAFVHVLAYGTAGPGQIIASLTVIFGLSIVLGTIYERTENLLVPALVHGVYNAILFANLYFTYA